MRAVNAAVVAPRRFELVERELAPGPGEVLVRVTACGICHSEMRPYLEGPAGGAPPLLLGHEVVGQVVEVGDGVDDLAAGDRVSGLLGQGFASHAVARADRLLRLPPGLPDAAALLEPAKCVITAARGAAYEFGDTVAVVGCGYMGLLVLACLRWHGARHLIAVDLDPARLALAREFGATAMLEAGDGQAAVVAAVQELTGGRLVDVAIEAAGVAPALELAVALLRRTRPKLVMVGYHNRPQMLDMTNFAVRGLIMHVTHPAYSEDQAEDLRRALWALESGVLPAERLVTHRFGLDRIGEGFELALTPRDGYLKGLVVP